MDQMRVFMQSDHLKEAMRNAGVVGQPDLYVLGQSENYTD